MSQDKDLELLKEHEDKVKKYQSSQHAEKAETNYRHLAYKVKNPFRGV